MNYVNIHTAAFPGGEIRGQLIRINTSPEIVCPADQTVECGSSMTYSATVTDQDGEAMEVVWLLNGDPVQSNSLAAAGPPSGGVVKYTGTLPFGENTLTLVATDTYGNVTTCSSTIQVQDTIVPVIENVKFSPKVLWPPNHKMIPIKIVPKIVDACGGTTWEIVSVSSNQAADAKGSGNTSPDWKITGDHSVLLRAERSGKDKGGRVYTIRILATDQAGNKSDYSFVKVTVPHDQGKDKDKDKDKGKKDKDKDKGKKGDKDKGKKK